ncbi:endonuclease VII domain-containing protein [Streptomyces sp. NPDC059909]|uniref:endonuclease VII domain-containing protein n=1 Tax=Streptomyces sp. NPDC059909 TaxID=3346998 RepID=UPI00365854FD
MRDGLQAYCRECAAAYRQERQVAKGRKSCKAVKGRAGHLKRQYGITESERDEMISSQMGICSICLAAPAVHVDHCHETGKVRGVLCFNCNSAIGKLGDDPDTVRRVAAYLEGNSWKPTLVAPGVCRLPS